MSKASLIEWRGIAAVIWVDWGGSGKGRLIDDLAKRAHIVARFSGGSNTGHTVENKHGKFALHIMPSGIFHKNTHCLIGRNVALDLESLSEEMDALDKAKVSYDNLTIDEQATLTMPWHKVRDCIREKLRSGNKKIGTTGKGVGPTYADRTERVGLLVKDLFSKDFRKKLTEEIKIQNKFFGLKLNDEKIYRQYLKISKRIKSFVGSTLEILREAQKSGKNILFEGAQGYFLDIDAGTYPFVTSSNPGIVGIMRSFDLHPSVLNEVIGITKSYTTRVGAGPMPTKIDAEIREFLIIRGKEKGTTTNRLRDPGWLDLVLIKAAAEDNRLTALAVTKLDVLSGLVSIKICVGYKLDGKKVDYLPHDAEFLTQVEPVYEEMSGWEEDIPAIRNFKDLPTSAKKYIKRIEKITNIPVKFISVGPERGQVIYV